MENTVTYSISEKTKIQIPLLKACIYIEKELGDWREELMAKDRFSYGEFRDKIQSATNYGVGRICNTCSQSVYVATFTRIIDADEIVFICASIANMIATDSSPDGRTFNFTMAPRVAAYIHHSLMEILKQTTAHREPDNGGVSNENPH